MMEDDDDTRGFGEVHRGENPNRSCCPLPSPADPLKNSQISLPFKTHPLILSFLLSSFLAEGSGQIIFVRRAKILIQSHR